MNYKLLVLVIIGIISITGISSAATYTSQYPPVHNTTYVKATTSYTTDFQPWFATNPATSLTGAGYPNVAWMSLFVEVDQRFHVDLGSAKPIKRIMYSNYHNSGTQTDRGIDNFTFWGSNTSSSFTTLTYATDTGWTQLTTSQSYFQAHAASNSAELRNITVTNTGSYRYYAFKISDGVGTDTLAFRRVELQTEDASADTTPPASITGLANNTATCTEINWTWTNPADADYNGTMIWENGTWLKNTTSTTGFDKWTGLAGGVSYTFSSKTFDNASTPNVNSTFQNMTAVATSCAVAPVASFTLDHLLVRIPHTVTATDTSTNTPTTWAWSWGDGTANSTTQNPTHTYTQRGKFTINMAATNAGGTGVATAATVRVVGYENP
jgi:hypothetical protein